MGRPNGCGKIQGFNGLGLGHNEACTVTSSAHEITELLQAWNGGDEAALEKLTPLVYQQLHRAARQCLASERPGHTLQATALINELYLRVIDLKQVNWQSRAHFFALCARLMRRILTDSYRSRQRQKRGAGAERVSLDASAVVSRDAGRDLLAIDEALNRLATVDDRKSQVVELRFFGGLSVKETAEVLKVSPDTVLRDWKLAKAWLLGELRG
jgi:RNA polymerase sigma-70 factor, ECF subfamily